MSLEHFCLRGSSQIYDVSQKGVLAAELHQVVTTVIEITKTTNSQGNFPWNKFLSQKKVTVMQTLLMTERNFCHRKKRKKCVAETGFGHKKKFLSKFLS